MARATYDSDVIENAGRQLGAATASLHELAATLANLSGANLPPVVAAAISHLNSKGHDIMTDIDEEATGLAKSLSQVASTYADLDSSIVCTFTGGGR